ncbi:gamma-glutamyl hydrolase A [Bombus terrestris]|uniref:folate gamma-glutamyl hydrolase n=1 Tax=Bombus terrestris TaxID=30195 RepID=A0A9B0C034_BOMTE|nr:gamma-glutamyl hydrolase A [Bombus terrestris]
MLILLVPFINFALTILQSTTVLGESSTVNNRPIIGILAQEKFSSNKSYIAASYVKFIEGAGARVVPLWIGRDECYYEDILSKINGVLWPGGSASFTSNKGYADAGYKIYKIAKRMNNNGDYFPILGICLGFELLTYVVAERVHHRTNCSAQSLPLELEFTPGYRRSRMFSNISDNVEDILRTKKVTSNQHQYCVTKRGLQCAGVSNKFRILSLNHDLDGVEFISSLEHITYPFYGLQFHPEKNLYEWIIGKKIPHGKNAIEISQYFANFFVNEARKNHHIFQNSKEEARTLIYNYSPTYTALGNSIFMQSYIFDSADTVMIY